MYLNLKLFIPTFIFVFIADMIWLGIIARDWYNEDIGQLIRKSGDAMSPNWPAAMVVYLAITIGILMFALPKSNGSTLKAIAFGALFGAVTYGIYDFTNFSVLNNWPIRITLIDFAWGIMLNAMTCAFSNTVLKQFIS